MKALAKKIANFILRKFGFEITRRLNTPSGYDFEQEAKRHIEIVRRNTMVSYAPLVTLFQQVRHCEIYDVPGSYVECGVWKGGAAGLMALGCLSYGSGRRDIYLFDAFDDICEPDPLIDGERAVSEVEEYGGLDRGKMAGRLQPIVGIYNRKGGHGTVEEVRSLLEEKIGYDQDFLHYHKGWFQNTLPEATKRIKDIAILRLDGDWYASTKVCLEFLYDKVVPGGFVVIDDYGTYEGCKKAVDEFMEKKGIKVFLSHANVDCRYWIKK